MDDAAGLTICTCNLLQSPSLIRCTDDLMRTLFVHPQGIFAEPKEHLAIFVKPTFSVKKKLERPLAYVTKQVRIIWAAVGAVLHRWERTFLTRAQLYLTKSCVWDRLHDQPNA